MTESRRRTGAAILADQLLIHGTTEAFGVPGESYLSVLDALRDRPIEFVVCRQEGGAAMMAEATAKLSGRPGICFASRGPGATNASAGVHVAAQDSTPLILFVGQISRGTRGREAFQELDCRQFFAPMAKWTQTIDDPRRIPEIVARAFHIAMSGRPGPVVIELPEDMLVETAAVADARPVALSDPAPSVEELRRAARLLREAERPLVIAGGSRWTEQGVHDLVRLSEVLDLPVAVSFRRQALFSSRHPNFAGELGVGCNPALAAYAREADVVLLLGGRLSEIPSQGYTLIDIPSPAGRLVHVHPGVEELNRVYQADVAINTTPGAFLAGLRAQEGTRTERTALLARVNAAYQSWSDPRRVNAPSFDLGRVVAELSEHLPDDAIIANSAGNYATWVHRFYRFRGFGTQLAPISGSMGYDVPAAVAAARFAPGRPVVAFAGDGCFLMNGQEFATAVQYALPIVVVVVDNGIYGTIRMHQERRFPGRVYGTTIGGTDFAALAVAYGGHGERVTRSEEFMPAFERARASGKPSVIHCVADPESLTVDRSLSEIRDAALQARMDGESN